MPDTRGLRLYVDIPLAHTPLTVEIEFPDKWLAKRYRYSAQRDKIVLSSL